MSHELRKAALALIFIGAIVTLMGASMPEHKVVNENGCVPAEEYCAEYSETQYVKENDAKAPTTGGGVVMIIVGGVLAIPAFGDDGDGEYAWSDSP